MQQGIHIASPGRLSRWGVVDVGLRCMHSCKFCYYVHLDGAPDPFHGMRHAQFLPTDHLIALADGLKANGFLGFDVTGGEPTLSPGIVELVRHASSIGLAARIITLGQYLMRRMKSAPDHDRLIDALLDAGVADFLLSVHGVTEESFKAATGESWVKQLAAMKYLDDRGFAYGSNTTVWSGNYRDLPAIARELARHNLYIANFIVMNAYYQWSNGAADTGNIQGHYGEIRPYLIEARDILEDAGIAVNVRYAPLCTMKGLERNLVGITGVRHDPHEWMNDIRHTAPIAPELMSRRLPLKDHQAHYPLQPTLDPPLPPSPRLRRTAESREPSVALAKEGEGGSNSPAANSGRGPATGLIATRASKHYPEKCRGCGAISVCDGVDANYLQRAGSDELQPYTEFRGDLLDRARLRYTAAHVVKLAGAADPRPLVKQLLSANLNPARGPERENQIAEGDLRAREAAA